MFDWSNNNSELDNVFNGAGLRREKLTDFKMTLNQLLTSLDNNNTATIVQSSNTELIHNPSQQITTNSMKFFGQEQECHSQTLPTSSALNCTSQDLYENIDFHPAEINFSDMKVLWWVKEPLNIVFRVSLVAPIVLLGILGNLIIIYSMLKYKPFRSKPTNIFILNMAIADLLTTLVCPLTALFTYIYQFYVLGPFICRIEGFVKITCFLVSSYSLIVLSSDWLLCVVKPCKKRITIRQSWMALITIWISSSTMAIPLLFWRKLIYRQWKDLVEIWCCELIQYSKYYWVVISFSLIYLPTFFMTIVLVVILSQIDKFEAKLRKTRTTQSNASLSISMKYRRRIVKILFTYLLTSIICWTPLQFFIIYRHFRSEAIPASWFFELRFFTSLSASLTAATNPIIFGFLSQPFRRVVAKSLMFKFFDKILTMNSRNSDNINLNLQNINNQKQLQAPDEAQVQIESQRATINNVPTKTGSKQQSPITIRHHHHHHHHHHHRLKTPTTTRSRNNDQSSPGSSRTNSFKHQLETNKKVSFNTLTSIRNGNENAAYENDGEDDENNKLQQTTKYSKEEQQVEPNKTINNSTTSFMQRQERFRPISVVSMDSINIEENLDEVEEDN